MEEEKKKPSSAEATDGKEKLNIEELKKQFDKCQKLKDEYLAGWQRARADLINYKKEELERIEELIKYAGEGLILKILPILDNLEIAEKEVRSMKYEETKYKEVINGFLKIKVQIQDFLRSQGVEEIECLGKKFDPNFMEVVEDLPSEALAKGEVEQKSQEPGTVIEEIQKGYKINGKLLRPAKVKVTK